MAQRRAVLHLRADLWDATAGTLKAWLLSAIDPQRNYAKIKMPAKANVTKNWPLPPEARAEIEAIIKKIKVDYAAVAAKAVKRRNFPSQQLENYSESFASLLFKVF